MASATIYSVCKSCGERHPSGGPHIWKDAPKSVDRAVQDVAEKVQQQVAELAAAVLDPVLSLKVAKTAKGGDLIAPEGKCEFCDARRAYTAEAMRQSRLRRKSE